MSESWSARTIAAQAGGEVDAESRAIVAPIHVASTFVRDPDNAYRSGNVYGRPDNETVREAERVIGALEGSGETLVFGSGMSAALALFLGLGPGAHVVAPRLMYWALRSWLATEAPAFGLAVDFVDTEDLSALRGAIKPGADAARVARDAEQSALGRERHRSRRGGRACGGRGARRRFDLRDADLHPAARARRRRRHALGDQVPERPFGRAGRGARLRQRRRAVRPRPRHPQGARPDPAPVRGVPADPGLENA